MDKVLSCKYVSILISSALLKKYFMGAIIVVIMASEQSWFAKWIEELLPEKLQRSWHPGNHS